MIRFIENYGDFFSSNYFDEDFTQKVLTKSGYSTDDIAVFNKNLVPLKDKYFRYKQLLLEGKLRTKDVIFETHQFHTSILNALGYDGDNNQYDRLFHLNEHDVLPIRHILYRGEQIHLMIMEMQPLIKEGDVEPDGLFEQRYNVEEEEVANPPQKYHRSQWDRVFQVPEGLRISPIVINKAISELLLIEQRLRPKYILLLAGNVIFLLEQEKWFRGSYLKFNLEELFTEVVISKNLYSLIYFLVSKEALAPDSNMVLMDQLDEDSHKSAYEVTKDLKEGIIHAVEALANEALYYTKHVLGQQFDESDDQFEQEVKDDCLTIIYRLLFIFYAESRDDLDILPTNDLVYERGYSLEMLRDLEQVPLHSDSSRNGYFFHESLTQLFNLLSSGFREKENGRNKSFKVRHIDSPMFDNRKLNHLGNLKFRNSVWQEIICQLSLSRQQRGRARGRISYANLGINQLGSVYESLLAYRGFYAEQDYIEVHAADEPKEGTYLVPRNRRDDFQENEIFSDEQGRDILTRKGTFVYRLSGRDRQRSASYYTPEILTQCTVKYALKPILERLERGEITALDILELKLLEPAMGAAAFHNEMINQLAEIYLNFRQKELNKRVPPDLFKQELQKVKAYIATNNVYGVDLNPTAIELGKLSLWLNVIHKDMETPFFSNRLAVGNAVVGAWFKVYREKDIIEEYEVVGGRRSIKSKEWWNDAPKPVEFGSKGIKRKSTDIYHFLLPDKNMVPSAQIKMLKDEYPAHSKRVSEWKKEWIKPLKQSEIDWLKAISVKIDELLKEYYQFQKTINIETQNRQNIFGGFEKGQQPKLHLKTYDEKEKLTDQRNRHNAPYFKLKMVMDYWCSLWFWDVRQAVELPIRQQYWKDIANILELELTTSSNTKKSAWETSNQIQGKLFDDEPQQNLNSDLDDIGALAQDKIIAYTNRKDLFDNNLRLELVKKLSTQYKFFHPQLDFLEVFWERGGFDLITGNPPWIKITFEEKGIISERFPEIAIRNTTAPEIKRIHSNFMADEYLKEMYLAELLGTECTKVFMNAVQNYPLLIGQQTNLYKCVIENGFTLLNETGFMGLLHPEGVYEDPNGQALRKEMYSHLVYHFQFLNELFLFQDVGHRMLFGTNVYKGKKASPNFISVNNLFHPSTIDGCFIHSGEGICGGFKIKDETDGNFKWNINPHRDRIIHCTEEELKLFATIFENTDQYLSVRLVNIQSEKIIAVLEKISGFERKVSDFETIITVAWDETGAVNNNILRETKFADINAYEFIWSGPHFHVGNPLNKTPRSICTEKGHYDVIDLSIIDENYFPRTNYIPLDEIEKYIKEFKGFELSRDAEGNILYDNWIDYYKLAFSKMLNTSSERTLQPAIIPQRTSHINGVISATFKDTNLLIEFSALSSSIIFDFLIKTIGTANLTNSRLISLPLGCDSKYHSSLFARTLLLNCLNLYYSDLWRTGFQYDFTTDSWSKSDQRFIAFSNLQPTWTWNTPIRNFYARRWALIEIDVITSMALNLSLDELITVYSISFPMMQQYEDETYYDQAGNIVFTVNRGLTGVGVDRPVWDQIQKFEAGETYEHIITRSELNNGTSIIYQAPFEKCDRVEDYKIAWKHFENQLK